MELKKVEFLNFGKYKVYENEYELLFDETDYATINYAMLQNIKILGAYSAK